MWSFVNKYFFTLVLLGASVTFQYDYFGFAYFLLFLIHTFAFYALRTSDDPIDILKNLRKNKRNLRDLFSYIYLIVSSCIFVCILLGQCIKNFNERSTPFSELMIESGSQRVSREVLRILSLISPNYDKAFSLLQSFIVFLLALVFYKTRKNEEQESIGKNLQSQRVVDTIHKVEDMRNYKFNDLFIKRNSLYQVQKAVQLIKDYKFKQQMFVHLKFIFLALVCSISCTILILPYLLIFTFQCVIISITKSEKTLRETSTKLNLLLIALLISDLLVKYFIKGGELLHDGVSPGFYLQVVGLLSNVPTYIDFYSKILLLIIQCQGIQYNYDYHTLYKEIKLNFKEKYELQKLFRKRGSFTFKIMKPISIFMFCSITILFILLHPSMIFLAILPLSVYGFFMAEQYFRTFSKFQTLIIFLFMIGKYSFYISYLLIPDNQKKEEYINHIEQVLGFQRDDQIYLQIFPGKFDFLICLILAYFSHCIQIEDTNIESSDQENIRINNLLRNGYEDDLITIADDVSEVRSKISYKTGYRYPQGAFSERSVTLTQRFRNNDIPETIVEDKKEEDEVEDVNTHRSHTINRKQNHRQQRAMKHIKASQRDQTFRGSIKTPQPFFKESSFYNSKQLISDESLKLVYLKLKVYFDNMLDLLIIHSAKFALFGIFMVSVTHANLFNAGLFMIFLFLSISNYREVQKYWKVPIIFDSFILLSLYAIDVFKPEEVLELDKATLKLIGIQSSQKDEIRLLKLNKQQKLISFEHLQFKYTPYLVLLCLLVITHYILNSQRQNINIQKRQSVYYFLFMIEFYEEFLQFYNQIEMRGRLEDEDENPFIQQQLKNSQIGITDNLTKFIIKYSLYLMLFALFVECSLLPVSVLNFILLVLMCIITIKYLKSDDSINLYKSINGNLVALKWISLVFIFLKYMFQFEDFAYTIAFMKQQNEIL